MNEKIVKYAKAEGFCCLWAFLEANRSKYTSTIMEDELKGVCTDRALRHARAKHRNGELRCEKLETCLKERLRQEQTNP